MTNLKVAVIWSRFGPYHIARLRGAALAMPEARVIGIEVASSDRDYAWSIERGADGFERTTVFPNQNYHDLSPAKISTGIDAALTRLQPDAVAINGWSVPEARTAVSWARRRGAHAILMSETKSDDRLRQWWKEFAKRVIVRRFDAALVGGQPHRVYLSDLGFPADRIRYGYNAVDNAYFEARSDAVRSEAAQHRAALGLPDRYFFACTRFLPRKNLDGLLRAYAAYRRKDAAPWSLVIAGGGKEELNLRNLANSLGLGHSVVWPGFVQYPDLPTYFGLASAFIHAARSEAWGLVVNEAAASALPLLIARTAGAAAQLVEQGKTGLLIDQDDDAAITRALATVASMTEGARTAMGRNARELVSQWGPERFGTELAASVASVLGRAGINR